MADVVRRVRAEKNLSLADVHRRSRGQIASSYVSRIENGYVLNVTPQKLKSLAKGLGVSEDEIFAAARGADSMLFDTDEGHLKTMIQKYRDLPNADKLELSLLIKVIDKEIDRRMKE